MTTLGSHNYFYSPAFKKFVDYHKYGRSLSLSVTLTVPSAPTLIVHFKWFIGAFYSSLFSCFLCIILFLHRFFIFFALFVNELLVQWWKNKMNLAAITAAAMATNIRPESIKFLFEMELCARHDGDAHAIASNVHLCIAHICDQTWMILLCI